ncbi:MAG: c-type cytochrome [Acidimicrobiia bacterium]|nr:MAG: c-type cytochrome [Acidimicrobiia bacterium]
MLSGLVMVVAAVVAVGWLAYLVAGSVRGKGKEDVAVNLRPGDSNEELEGKRLDTSLVWSVAFAAFLALSIPIYFLGEVDRQAGFEDEFYETALEHGKKLSATTEDGGLNCMGCHGANYVGGAASYVEPRSNVTVTWSAPRLDTIFYRYSREEVKFWLIYGRPGSPMPAWGLEGGGPLNDQEIEDILTHMESLQLPQDEALALIEGDLAAAQRSLEGADASVAATLADQQTLVSFALDAPQYETDLLRLHDEITALAESEGIDVDGDGVSDEAENGLPALFEEVASLGLDQYAVAGVTNVDLPSLDLDPRNPVTNGLLPDGDLLYGYIDDEGHEVEGVLSRLIKTMQLFEIAAQNQERTLDRFQLGLDFLEGAVEDELWEVDVQAVADATFGGDVDTAQRAVNLFNANCARCHTTGYSAGPAFQGPIGGGGFGPSLLPPRALIQFDADPELLASFLISGSEEGQPYGVNGIGRGYMPAFGGLLPREDIDLLVAYLMGSTLGGPNLMEGGS